jgi:putative lipoprotein (rSAM/lipoprotein system)
MPTAPGGIPASFQTSRPRTRWTEAACLGKSHSPQSFHGRKRYQEGKVIEQYLVIWKKSSIFEATADLIHMKNGVKQIWKYLAAGIMGLLGFASCGKSLADDSNDSAMYGPPPNADYKVLGTVSDEDGRPIKGIRVSVRLKYSPWSKDVEETLYSDDKGAYQLLTRSLDGLPPVTISFEDVDGEENGGEFESTEVTPEVKRTKDGDGTGSYQGAFEFLADVQLKKK